MGCWHRHPSTPEIPAVGSRRYDAIALYIGPETEGRVKLWNRLEVVRVRHDALRHPFYVRWSEGALTRADLAHYSGQYRHAVVALAAAAAAAAQSSEAGTDAAALAEHAAEEASHVALWDEFVAATGGRTDAEPSTETRECAAAWAGDESRPLTETLAAMFAIESAQPAISTTKRAGLVRHYGIEATAYFDVHERLDIDHAAQAREMISRRLPDVDEDALVATAARVLAANWRLLDGVEAACRVG
jgi:pyrroloquinoline quinone (PQQ) biosynthesis protein C